jgi:hypothetical protein
MHGIWNILKNLPDLGGDRRVLKIYIIQKRVGKEWDWVKLSVRKQNHII